MFGSQALEVAIGLALTFFIIALAASGMVEVISRILSKRAVDLKNAIEGLLANEPGAEGAASDASADADRQRKADLRERVPFDIYETSIMNALAGAAGTSASRKKPKGPSYVSAKDFADSVVELLLAAKEKTADAAELADSLPPQLRKRVEAIVSEVGNDLTAIKSGLEQWFDSAMKRLEGSYKRWATFVLFLVGLFVTVFANASAFHIAQDLWGDSTIRAAIVESATVAIDEPATDIQSVSEAVEELDAAQLPIGWDDETRKAFFETRELKFVVASIGGWMATALLVMLGAPFWYDLLTKLVSLRSSGKKPLPADRDDLSATSAMNPTLGAAGRSAITINARGAADPSAARRRAPATASKNDWSSDLFQALGGVPTSNTDNG